MLKIISLTNCIDVTRTSGHWILCEVGQDSHTDTQGVVERVEGEERER